MYPDAFEELPEMIPPRQLAEYLGTTTEQLAQWRHERTGPPYTKITAGTIRYRKALLRAYIEENTKQPQAVS